MSWGKRRTSEKKSMGSKGNRIGKRSSLRLCFILNFRWPRRLSCLILFCYMWSYQKESMRKLSLKKIRLQHILTYLELLLKHSSSLNTNSNPTTSISWSPIISTSSERNLMLSQKLSKKKLTTHVPTTAKFGLLWLPFCFPCKLWSQRISRKQKRKSLIAFSSWSRLTKVKYKDLRSN